MRAELAVARLEDHCADDVAWQQVGRELYALEIDAECAAKAAHEKRLREAWHTLEEHVAIRKQRDEEALDDVVLTDDGFADFIA
jgi:hypothetical protein